MRFSLLLLLLVLLTTPAFAFESPWVKEPNVKARLVQDDEGLGIEMQMEEGWYTYYKNPGEAGIPTTFKWDGSRDLTVNKVEYPESQYHDEAGLKVYVYEEQVRFPVDAEYGRRPLANLLIEGAVCNEICVPYSIKIESKLPSPIKKTKSYFSILWTALLAGLILNIMPCVLPVLSLKVLGVVKQSGEEKKRARFNFLATSAGIIVSFWILAGLAVGLKSAGMAVGWGLHFQSPIFVAVLMVITLIFAASLFGLFHLRPPSWVAGGGSHNTVVGNFFSGMLATLLGTSCTAPILTTAVGFALSRDVFDIILIFTLMGVGMALPFLLFALRPQIATYLPKPGAWMVKVKYVMGVLLVLTAVWLGYVLSTQLIEPKPMPVISTKAGEWQQFSEDKIERYIAEGKTVFVDVTAEWCVNCKANKVAVLDTEEITKLFSRSDIVLLRGDMTKPDKTLLLYIKKYDRYGIPFNIVYGPKSPEGLLLSPILTKEDVKKAVQRASGK